MIFFLFGFRSQKDRVEKKELWDNKPLPIVFFKVKWSILNRPFLVAGHPMWKPTEISCTNSSGFDCNSSWAAHFEVARFHAQYGSWRAMQSSQVCAAETGKKQCLTFGFSGQLLNLFCLVARTTMTMQIPLGYRSVVPKGSSNGHFNCQLCFVPSDPHRCMGTEMTSWSDSMMSRPGSFSELTTRMLRTGMW